MTGNDVPREDSSAASLPLTDLLELLYSAPNRYRRFVATVERVEHRATVERLLAETGDLQRDVATARQVPPQIRIASVVWAEQPARFRWEAETFHGDELLSSAVGVKLNGNYWLRTGQSLSSSEDHPGSSVMTVEELIADPAPLLGISMFDAIRSSSVAGREAIEADAHRRETAGPSDRWSHLVDSWRLAVDRERGVLLNLHEFAQGYEISSLVVTDISFDGAFSDGTFRPLTE